MHYTKPEVNTLGDAFVVIEGSNTKGSNHSDSADTQAISPAYDLDD